MGNAACACAAGDLYRRGSLPALPLSATTSNDSVVPDLHKAIEYFEKGAAAGHALSMVYLATMLSRGQGVTKVHFAKSVSSFFASSYVFCFPSGRDTRTRIVSQRCIARR